MLKTYNMQWEKIIKLQQIYKWLQTYEPYIISDGLSYK